MLTLIFLVAIFYVVSNFEDWKEDYRKAELYKAEKDKFISMCLGTENYENQPSALFAKIMDCVHENSVHAIDEEFRALFKQGRHAYLNRINSNLSTTETDVTKPHMECSTRSKTIADILRYMGYEAHEAALAKDEDNFPDHVVVNVRNPMTDLNEMYDPTYNIFVKTTDTSVIQSVENLLLQPFEKLLFCNPAGDCDTNLMSQNGNFNTDILPPYYGIAYMRVYEDPKGPLLYNPDRFDPDKIRDVWGEKKSYCDVHPDHCKRRKMVKSPSP